MPDLLCVFCRRQPVDPAWRPFCSERCKMIDLGLWASERYRVPDKDSGADENPGSDPDSSSSPSSR